MFAQMRLKGVELKNMEGVELKNITIFLFVLLLLATQLSCSHY